MNPSFQPIQPVPPSVASDRLEIASELEEIGLTIEDFERAFSAAQRATAEWSHDHSPTSRGTAPYDAAIAELRRLLRRRRWRIVDEQSQALAIHPTREIAIMVANGDSATGDPDADPRTRAAKGRRTRRAVEQNQRQATFAELMPEFEPPERETWMFLIRTNPDPRSARAELSQPRGFDKQGRVAAWDRRLILTRALRLGDASSPAPTTLDWGYPARIHIQVGSKRNGAHGDLQSSSAHDRPTASGIDQGGARLGGGTGTSHNHPIRTRSPNPTRKHAAADRVRTRIPGILLLPRRT